MRKIREEYPFLYETHLHTSQSSACAASDGERMARACRAAGYTGVFVTDHNWGGNTAVEGWTEEAEALRSREENGGELLPRPIAARRGGKITWKEWVCRFAGGYEAVKRAGEEIGLDVFFGWEAGYRGTEFLIYGLTPEWLAGHPQLASASVMVQHRMIREAGGMVIHAHPYREEYYIPDIRIFPEWVDGVEGVNATHSSPESRSHNNPEFDKKAIAYAAQYNLPMTAGSDIHTDKLLGGGMAFKRRLNGPGDFVAAVLGGEDYLLTDGSVWYDRSGSRV